MDKKKLIGIIVLVILLLIGVVSCTVFGQKEPEVVEPTTPPATEPAPTQEPTVEPTAVPTEPSWEPGVIKATYGGAIAEFYNLGDTVTVKGEFDGYFIIEGEEMDLLIETRYLRHAGEEAFKEYVGYSYSGTAVYETAYLTGDAIASLALNDKVDVIEGKENWLHIKWNGGEGYVEASGISPNPIVYTNGGSSGPQDGTDIDLGSLSASGVTGGVQLLSSYYGPIFTEMEAVEGTILTNECEAYMYLYSRGDEAKIHEVGEETCIVLIEGQLVTIPRWLVQMEGDEAYEPWTGYTASVDVYSKHQMREIYEVRQMNVNEKVNVIDKLPHCYVVEVDGEICYIALDAVSKTPFTVSKGNGGGSSSSGEWTPPAL